jgi:uncharacterized membrane protein YhaH (DUF805 family)
MNNPFKSIIFTYKNSFNISGRSDLYEFCIFNLFGYLLLYGTSLLIEFTYTMLNYDPVVLPALELAYGIIFIFLMGIPSITLAIRRLHDLDINGYHLLWCITIIGLIPITVLLFSSPQEQSNQYGEKKNSENITYYRLICILFIFYEVFFGVYFFYKKYSDNWNYYWYENENMYVAEAGFIKKNNVKIIAQVGCINNNDFIIVLKPIKISNLIQYEKDLFIDEKNNTPDIIISTTDSSQQFEIGEYDGNRIYIRPIGIIIKQKILMRPMIIVYSINNKNGMIKIDFKDDEIKKVTRKCNNFFK